MVDEWTPRPHRADYTDAKEYRRAYDRWRDKNDPKRLARNTDPERHAKSRAWYAANREAALAQKKVYFQENREQIRDYQRDYARERYHADPEFRAKSIARAQASNRSDPERRRANNERYRADPVNRAEKKKYNARYRDENRDKIYAQTAKFREENREFLRERQRQWRAANLEKDRAMVREYQREHRDELISKARERRENDPEFAAYLDTYRKEYYENNKPKFIAHNALREERIQRATPPWLTKEQQLEMELIYRDAAELTLLTGVRHEVDHIQPIKGRKSCGLHVPWNLQVLTWRENNRKRNREPENG